jgi:hypothetical protein
MTKLGSVTVGVGGSSEVIFSNIPQGYSDLKIVASARVSAAGNIENVGVRFNGSSAAEFSVKEVYFYQTSTGSSQYSSQTLTWFAAPAASITAGVFSNTEINLTDYTGNTLKNIDTYSVVENAASNIAIISNASWIWNNPSPITSIRIFAQSGTLVQHSNFILYGIKNARQTAGNSIKATGGNIVFDGTYVYHVFDSTGAFTPTQPILADYLVIAGGGSGAPSRGGGGGAGGLRSTVSPTGGGGAADPILSLVPGTYTVTVGAGATAINGRASGNNSSFATIISTGGGGGASPNQGIAALSGGSGGGGGFGLAAGSASPSGQGYAGGAGHGTFIGGAGGGGAGAVGSNASSTNNNGGNGGNGILGTAWSVATGTGVNGYYAGGGGGGFFSDNGTTGGTGGLGGGGNGKTTSTAAIDGRTNTGGGGGSGRGNPGGIGDVVDGANGGSGLVIVRYKG